MIQNCKVIVNGFLNVQQLSLSSFCCKMDFASSIGEPHTYKLKTVKSTMKNWLSSRDFGCIDKQPLFSTRGFKNKRSWLCFVVLKAPVWRTLTSFCLSCPVHVEALFPVKKLILLSVNCQMYRLWIFAKESANSGCFISLYSSLIQW